MKHPFYVLFLLIANVCFAQKPVLTVDLSVLPHERVKLIFPVDGTVFPGNQSLYTPDKLGRIRIPNPVKKAGIVYAVVPGAFGFKFFIEPGNTYSIRIDTLTKGYTFTYSGPNADGQRLLNQLKHDDYQATADRYSSKGTTFRQIDSLINRDAEAEQQLFEGLFAGKKVNRAFLALARQEVRYFFATVTSAVIFNHRAEPEFAGAWPALFARFPFTDAAAFAAPSFNDYLEQYASWYRGSYQSRQNGTFKVLDSRQSNEYLVVLHDYFRNHLSGGAREYGLARFLSFYLSQKKYEPELTSFFEAFKKDYPASAYTRYLQPEINEVRVFQEKKKKDLGPGQTIVTNYLAVKTIDELLAPFNGKVVFVDLWATWCGPCKEEFEYNPALTAFLKGKNAEILYVSMDDQYRDQQWKDMIRFYDLAGTHLRVSEELRKELITVLWKGKLASIPRYLIVKDGKIVEKDAKRPSSGKELFDQLSMYL